MKTHGGYAVMAALGVTMSPAHAIDLLPGEIRAPRGSANFFHAAYESSTRGDLYLKGEKQPGKPKLRSTQVQLRLARSFELAGLPAFFYAQTPIGRLEPGGSLAQLDSVSGVGDTTLLLAVWPYADHQAESYFGVGGYLTLPTGSYRAGRELNIGGNRYNAALQAGYQTALGERLHGMVAVDGVWFGRNSEYRATHDELERDALYTAQAGLRYDLTPRYSIGASYFHTLGGETRVNGVARDDKSRLNRYQLTGMANFKFGRIGLQYGGDLDTRHGLIEESRWTLRYTKGF